MAPRLTDRERRVGYGMLFTMPGVPFLYYGDEIGMRYRDISTKEGGYARTGSRTPMQWDGGRNDGFSTADPENLYLPVDPDPHAPNVAEQQDDSDSMLHWVESLLRLRRRHPALSSSARLDVVAVPEDGRLFAYRRTAADEGESLLVALNPGLSEEGFDLPADAAAGRSLLSVGDVRIGGGRAVLGPQSFAVVGK